MQQIFSWENSAELYYTNLVYFYLVKVLDRMDNAWHKIEEVNEQGSSSNKKNSQDLKYLQLCLATAVVQSHPY